MADRKQGAVWSSGSSAAGHKAHSHALTPHPRFLSLLCESHITIYIVVYEKICGEALWEPESVVCSVIGANVSPSIQSYQAIHKGLLKWQSEN